MTTVAQCSGTLSKRTYIVRNLPAASDACLMGNKSVSDPNGCPCNSSNTDCAMHDAVSLGMPVDSWKD